MSKKFLILVTMMFTILCFSGCRKEITVPEAEEVELEILDGPIFQTNEEKQISDNTEQEDNNTIWFKISCWDGLTHLQYCRDGMSFRQFAASEYNTEKWYITEDDKLVRVIGNAKKERYIICDNDLEDVIESGRTYKTDVYEPVNKNSNDADDPAYFNISEIESYISEIEPEIIADTNVITVWDLMSGITVAYKTIYTLKYDRVESITATYYMPPYFSSSLLDYLNDYEEFESIEKVGNSYVCIKSKADCDLYSDMSYNSLLEMLQSDLEARQNIDTTA